ncbi:MAG: hypothetical protein WBH28_15995 [Fuerstiella sp.]
MNRPYIDQDTLDEIRNAYGCGIPLERLAAQLNIAEEALRRLLRLPQWQPEPPLQKSLDWTR